MPTRRPSPRGLAAACALLLAVGCAANIAADLLGLPAQTTTQQLPPDVQQFVIQQNKCDDWRRAVAAGDPRREQLGRDIVAICGKKHQELARLKTKYGDDPQVLYTLRFYEEE